MESRNITIDPQTTFDKGKAETMTVPLDNTLTRSTRIKKIQTTAMILLFLAAVINYLDRSSLSVANLTIREDLGLSATEIGALLSVFSLAYGIAQLPCGPLLDRKGPRIMLGLGMFFWSLFQAVSGMVHSFTQFVLVRIGMGIGEAPMNPCGVKVINDWFNIKERGRPMGFFNAASTIGVAISPPILAAMMLMMGWRGMFITIGVLGIFVAIGWYMLYRNREDRIVAADVGQQSLIFVVPQRGRLHAVVDKQTTWEISQHGRVAWKAQIAGLGFAKYGEITGLPLVGAPWVVPVVLSALGIMVLVLALQVHKYTTKDPLKRAQLKPLDPQKAFGTLVSSIQPTVSTQYVHGGDGFAAFDDA